jgi:hypothetical protein
LGTTVDLTTTYCVIQEYEDGMSNARIYIELNAQCKEKMRAELQKFSIARDAVGDDSSNTSDDD